MTGATSGLGKVAAAKLANSGARLIVLARNAKKGDELKEYYSSNWPEGKGVIELVEGNLNSFRSIEHACKTVIEKYTNLDMIIQNAGIFNFSYQESEDKIEETLQVNLLAPILITHLLSGLLARSKNPRLIFTASALHQGSIRFDDIEFKKTFSSFNSYRQSKLGIILMTRLFAEKFSNKNICVFCQHPGFVNTNLGDNSGPIGKFVFWAMGKSAEKGAENLLFLSNNEEDELVSGEYYMNNKVKKITRQSYDLNMALALLARSRDYLKEYIKEPSAVFPE
jgi:NAD(P)-dependent dehydrogenase (short-subunit alcohol dehydrogenase family)